MRRITAAILLAIASLLPATAAAATWDARMEMTGFRMQVGAPGAELCVVFPVTQRGGGSGCDKLDLSIYGNEKLNELLAVVHTETYWVTVTITSAPDAVVHGDLTAAEQREFFESVKAPGVNPPSLQIQPALLPPTRIHGVQVLRTRSEITGPDTDNVQTAYVVIGAAGPTAVKFTYRRDLEQTVEPIIASMLDTMQAEPAPSVAQRLGTSLLSLLAGAPLVVIAAAVASRKSRNAAEDA